MKRIFQNDPSEGSRGFSYPLGPFLFSLFIIRTPPLPREGRGSFSHEILLREVGA
jgi:hypothetical protein